MPIKDWISGFTIPNVDIMTNGDFLLGADQDLLSTVYPIQNTNDPII